MNDAATKIECRTLYLLGWPLSAITEEKKVPARTLRQWRTMEGWDNLSDPAKATNARLVYLVNRGAEKTEPEWKEMERLADLFIKLQKGAAKASKASRDEVGDGDEDPRPRKTGKGRKGREDIHEIGHIDLSKVKPLLFKYQREITEDDSRGIIWLKSRQVGATKKVIAWRQTRRAIQLGNNQISISASKNQVGQIRKAIKELFLEVFGITLKGNKDEITIHKHGKPWATFYFLSTNSSTAQSYDGDVTIDEAAWIPRFETMLGVARPMATLKRYSWFVCSTPSTINHYFWKLFQGKTDAKGRTISDGAKRIKTTIYDAVAGGNELVDINQLRQENPEAQFRNKYLCEPIDDEESIFRMDQLEACMSDPATWGRPAYSRIVIGYDPSRYRDLATMAILGLIGERWRLIKHVSFKNKSFAYQGSQIIKVAFDYGVDAIGIDTTGMGGGVYEEIKGKTGCKIKKLNYSHELKTHLVTNVQSVVQKKRLEYESGDSFVTGSFLAIKQVGTDSGRVTYKAGRTAETGHAEAFWAIAHGLYFDKGARRGRSRVA